METGPEIDLREQAIHDGVPAHIAPGLAAYAIRRRRCGSFIMSVLANDLFSAVQYADPVSKANLSTIVRFVYMNLPARCWGSAEAVNAWLGGEEEPSGLFENRSGGL